MKKPYGLIADIHLHRWSAFATTFESGINSRLNALLGEIARAAAAVQAAGGDTLVVAGDLFHVRGQLAPSVLNPTLDTFRDIIASGVSVFILPGNHDLEGKESDRVGSAVTALEGVGCMVVHEGTMLAEPRVVLVPWVEKVDELKALLTSQDFTLSMEQRVHYDLIIHAPINGVIIGIPDHGLEPTWLRDLGFNRVFAGHYHNHKDFCASKVFSIGALAHHTWSDVGSQAGFIIVHESKVDFHPSILPKFIDVTPEMKAEDVKAIAKGNFLRVKVSTSKVAEINAMREWLTAAGALGVIIISVKKAVDERTGALAASVSAGASIHQSVSAFIQTLGLPDPKLVELGAMEVLAAAEVA